MYAKTAITLFDLLTTGDPLIAYCESCFSKEENPQAAIDSLDKIEAVVQAVNAQSKNERLPNRVNEICLNLIYYINRLKNFQTQSPDSVLFDVRYHLKSLFRILKYEIAYLAATHVNPSDYPDFYPETCPINQQQIAEQGKTAKYQASIVVLAYNNLSYVRNCVESILKNTEGIHYELILVDNGSTDGTKAYFDSIQGAKVIHLEHNLHVVKGFNIGLMAAEGKYSAAVCNDFIFPKNWLSNLLICMESDPNIGYASPGATSISNHQQISIPFTSIEQFQKDAEQFNVSDPRKWQERVVLLPNVLCCPTALLNQIGYYDTRFYRGEFSDDDLSFRIRRAGYKLIYCADTVTHHYGSLTTVTDHQTNSLQEGKDTFFKKYGLDAWSDARIDLLYQSFLYDRFYQANAILGIDVKCGATFLQIKNEIWKKHGVHTAAYAATTEEKYLQDLKSITTESWFIHQLNLLPDKVNQKFNLIYIEKSLDCYCDDLESIFLSFSKILHPQGHLIFRLDNCSSFNRILDLLQSNQSVHNKKVYLEEAVCACAERYHFQKMRAVNLINKKQLNKIQSFTEIVADQCKDSKYLEQLLEREASFYQMVYNP